jgi:hypothetical protein
MLWRDLEFLVYYDGVFDDRFTKLPGTDMEKFLVAKEEDENYHLLHAKLSASCRKMIMMWVAGDRAIEAEAQFYSATYHDSPALFGEEAVNLHYHLESFVLFARSALDIASRLFGELLPEPFQKKRFDSFNDLVKSIMASSQPPGLAATFESLRDNPFSWLSFVADIQKGRSLRDKLVHQIGFPIEYMELRPPSEKESAVVFLGKDKYLPLPQFVNTLREGVINGFLLLEQACLAPPKSAEPV